MPTVDFFAPVKIEPSTKEQRRALYRFGQPKDLVRRMNHRQARDVLAILVEVVEVKGEEDGGERKLEEV